MFVFHIDLLEAAFLGVALTTFAGFLIHGKVTEMAERRRRRRG